VARDSVVATAIRDLQSLFEAGTFVGMSDGQLLDRFIARREGASLEALVLRHGPMVRGVCRRVLRDYHDVEDAFQATFLVLARKAASIMPREKVGNWLYGVAYQTAMKARATRAKRRIREGQIPDGLEPEAFSHVERDDLAELLDRELSRLPDKYRTPVVLCELEGNTHGEAAERLGWPIGTVSGRLSRARAMLAKRLTGHGVLLPGGALTVGLRQARAMASDSVPTSLLSSTIKAASQLAAGRAAMEGVVSSRVANLTREVLKSMLFSRIKISVTTGLAFILAGAGLWQAAAWAAEDPAAGTFRVTVTEVIHDDATIVAQIGVESLAGSTIEVKSDGGKDGGLTATQESPKSDQEDEKSHTQFVIMADQVEWKEGSPNAFKFAIHFKQGKISSSTGESGLMPEDAETIADLVNVPIKSGQYRYDQAKKLVTFKGVTYTLLVNRPK
jgi:RNA polymerase sigma factor (sigma-70 family)